MRTTVRMSSLALFSVALLTAPALAALQFLGSYDGTVAGGSFGHACIVVGDMDGDGADEFAIGAPADPSGGANAGRVFIYRGGDPLPALPTWVITGEPGDRLGTSLTSGYVDDDLRPDLIIGAPGSSTATGRVVIAYGSNPIGTRTLQSVLGTDAGSEFGAAVAGLHNFGSLRFLVGAPGTHAHGGAVHAFASGDPPSSVFVIYGGFPGPKRFGAALSNAGITRGFIVGPEFLVGAPGIEGAAAPGGYFLYLYDAPNDTVPDHYVVGYVAGPELGRSISGGVDINSNFFEPSDDWVVGAPGDVNGGTARPMNLTYHAPDGSGGHFGRTVRLMYDVTRSNAPDMAIADDGAVHVYAGALTANQDPIATLTPDGDGEDFGRSISNSGRMNPNSERYLFMVGAPGALASTGKVYVYGDPTPPTSVPPPGAVHGIEFGPPAPNPSPGAFAWSLRLERSAHVRLTVVDLVGREMTKLHDGPLAAGRTDFEWRPRATAAPGIYWGVLEADGERRVRRMVRIR